MMNNEKFEELQKLCDSLNDKCAQLEEEVISYRQNLCPRFMLKSPLYVVTLKDAKFDISEITPDEIITNVYGIHYREYIGEDDFKQYPEMLCFKTKEEAQSFIEEQKKANN